MESLFGYAPTEKGHHEKKDSSSAQSPPRFIQIIDPKKSQNLAILLKALNVTTEEVVDAINEGSDLPASPSLSVVPEGEKTFICVMWVKMVFCNSWVEPCKVQIIDIQEPFSACPDNLSLNRTLIGE